jgi:hypothetical protein
MQPHAPVSRSQKWITDAHRLHFRQQGYTVVRGVIPPKMVANAVADMTAFIGADLAGPATWYSSAPVLEVVVHQPAAWHGSGVPAWRCL